MTDVRIKQSVSPLKLVAKVLDALTIGSCLYLSQWAAGQDTNERSLLVSAIAVVIYFFVSEATTLYQSGKNRCANRDLALVLGSWFLTIMILAALAFFTRQGDYFARSSILGWIFLTGSALGMVRMLTHIGMQLSHRFGLNTKRCAIAGINELGVQLVKNAEANPQCGLRMDGFYDDRSGERLVTAHGRQVDCLGKLEVLVEKAKAGEIDTVFVTLPMRAESRIRWLLDQLADTTVNAYIVPDFFVFELLHSRWNSIGGLPAVSVFETPLYGVDGWMKRTFDFLFASLGILLLFPVLVVCATLVKITSPGPIIFRQKRYGLDGKEIIVWKFRSMTTCENGSEVEQATKNDSRLTPIGGVLRRTSLDELPQLFNVLSGGMSLVGPRPHANAHNEHYRKLIKGYMLRHKVKPGITGLAQVEGYRGETETLDKMQKRIEFDHSYIQQWSIWLDVKIILRTFLVVFRQENAY